MFSACYLYTTNILHTWVYVTRQATILFFFACATKKDVVSDKNIYTCKIVKDSDGMHTCTMYVHLDRNSTLINSSSYVKFIVCDGRVGEIEGNRDGKWGRKVPSEQESALVFDCINILWAKKEILNMYIVHCTLYNSRKCVTKWKQNGVYVLEAFDFQQFYILYCWLHILYVCI